MYVSKYVTHSTTHIVHMISCLNNDISHASCSVTRVIKNLVLCYQQQTNGAKLIDQELKWWKFTWEGKSQQDQPSSCAQGFKEYDIQPFPNIKQLLKLVCTLPVISCECERSARVHLDGWTLSGGLQWGRKDCLHRLWYTFTKTCS